MIAWTRSSWFLAGVLVSLACSNGKPATGLLPAASGGSKGIAAHPPSSSGGDDSVGVDEPVGGDGATSTPGAGAAGESTGGAAAEGGATGAAGQGASGEATAGGDPPWMEPEHDPVCVVSDQLTNAKKLAISSPDVDQLGGVSADELVIAWTVVSGEQVTLHYARRAQVQGGFATPEALVIPAASESVSLSADGLRVVYVDADRKGFSQLVRTSTDQPFELVDSRDFALIRESADLFESDEYVGDPVLSPDDSSFVYSRYGAGRKSTLLLSERFSPYAPWPEGAPLAVTAELEATEASHPHPTAVSRDLETLFFWDPVTSSQRVAVLAHDTRTYDVSLDLGDARGAAPNAACSRVFYDSAGDLWTADFGAAPP